MVRHIEAITLKAKPTRSESKADITTAAALGIIESEAAAREAKTARLRAARLALPAAAEAPKASRTRKK